MKSLILAAAIAATGMGGLAGAAQAAPLPPISEVNVTIGPELQAKADKYGQRELDMLRDELRRDVTRALARSGSAGPGGARLEIVLADARPNRPTFKELGDRPGLSFESFGVGGARIEGRVVYPDGHADPVRYQWYETDIRWAQGAWTWADTTSAFQMFADRLSRGEIYAER